MYDPTVGRFLSEDPIEADVNSYRYCYNSPMTHTDPTGLASQRGAIPSSWWWWIPYWPQNRNDVLKNIPRLTPPKAGESPGKGQIPRGVFPTDGTKGIKKLADEWWKGSVPQGGMAGPFGTGPCVGVILIPDDPRQPIIILHINAGNPNVRGGLDAAGAKKLKGYKAIIVGGEGNAGLLNDVIGTIRSRGGTIKGYVPAGSAGVDDKGNIYWTDPATIDDANKRAYGHLVRPPRTGAGQTVGQFVCQ